MYLRHWLSYLVASPQTTGINLSESPNFEVSRCHQKISKSSVNLGRKCWLPSWLLLSCLWEPGWSSIFVSGHNHPPEPSDHRLSYLVASRVRHLNFWKLNFRQLNSRFLIFWQLNFWTTELLDNWKRSVVKISVVQKFSCPIIFSGNKVEYLNKNITEI